MPKITIVRSFSRTKQIAQFEPINAFCSASMEVDSSDLALAAGTVDEGKAQLSQELDNFCRAEVDKTIEAEIAKRRTIDTKKIKDSAKVEAELDAGHSAKGQLYD